MAISQVETRCGSQQLKKLAYITKIQTSGRGHMTCEGRLQRGKFNLELTLVWYQKRFVIHLYSIQ